MRLVRLVVGLCTLAAPAAVAQEEASVERGRYLVITAACNDCHTAGYAEAHGNIPESEWLKGDLLGWRGPWGTTYPVNLRLRLSEMTEDEWAEYAKVFETRPPMPWYNIHPMTEADIRSIYKYATSFEDKGEPAPEFVPPDQEPETPYVQFPSPPPQQ
jgi:hypothetical protein